MVIKCKDEEGNDIYVRTLNMAEGTLTFTNDKDNAGHWDSWNAEMARDWFTHHYSDKYPMIKTAELRDR